MEAALLYRLASLAIAVPRRILVAAALMTVALGIFGVPIAKDLSPSGFQDPDSESTRAAEVLTEKFGRGDVQMLIVVSSPDGIDSPAAREAGTGIVDQLGDNPHVADVSSPWSSPSAAAADLVSGDRTAGLIIAVITGTEAQQQVYAAEISEQVTRDAESAGGVTVRTGGTAMVNVQITAQSQRDLLLMESLAIPLIFLVLVWVFGGLLAAAVLQMFGLGLTLAVLVDATLVRMVLVPAFMHLMGRWNWWAPHWLGRVHNRLGFSEAPGHGPTMTATRSR
ncbi:MAG: MMPL family transporter [Mycobacterium sp.]